MLSKEQIKKINWYKQAGATMPLMVAMPASGINKPMYDASGFYLPNECFVIIKEDNQFMFYHYFDYDLCNQQMDRVFDIIAKKDKLFEKLNKNFFEASKKMKAVGEELIITDIDDKKFKQLYQDFLKHTSDFWANTVFLDMMDPFGDRIIDFIFGSQRKNIDKHQLNILLSPDEKSNLQKEQEDLLAIYKKAKEQGIDDEINKLLEQHSKKYFWLNSSYQDVKYLDAKYFANILSEWLDSNETDFIEKDLEKFAKTLEDKKKIISELKLDKDIIRRLNFFNSLTILRDERKKTQLINSYYLLEVVNKLAKKYNVSWKQLVKLYLAELNQLLDGNLKILDKLKDRDRDGLVVETIDKQDYATIIEGVTAQERFELIEDSMVASEIKGMTASRGKVVGNAKIINKNEDFAKVEQGDIIVTAMTRPEFLPIMKKAAAIVTDEGGITCHAAIVSRELGIPCIIGCQVATKILDDGDFIDVNADHGLVKIIKKAS